jgi:peptide-methionine (R)-S-oxide reductase
MDVTRRRFLIAANLTVLSMVTIGAWAEGATWASPDSQFAVTHTDAEWRKLLSPPQYDVLRTAGTEAPYSSPLNDEHRRGVFSCAGCALHLYSSDTKFDSGTGWPSFWKALDNAVLERPDTSLGMIRTEVLCSQCGGHLGHVFNDGPQPTGLRYCMNGVAMIFNAL